MGGGVPGGEREAEHIDLCGASEAGGRGEYELLWLNLPPRTILRDTAQRETTITTCTLNCLK